MALSRRLELQEVFEAILQSQNVYFQPPNNVQLKYPCIIYERLYANTIHADNNPYKNTFRYMVTVIAQDPDSAIVDKVALLPLCSYERFYTADNLNHDVFNLYF